MYDLAAGCGGTGFHTAPQSLDRIIQLVSGQGGPGLEPRACLPLVWQVYLGGMPEVHKVLTEADKGLGVFGKQHIVLLRGVVYAPHFALLLELLNHAEHR